MPFLPATTLQISMGQVKRGYTNTTGNNIYLSLTLGSYIGFANGIKIELSKNFGGRFVPYNF